jgi:hypothetical protein
MAIHYYDKNGTRAQFTDRNALVDALRRDLISGDTKVFVPAKNDFVPLKDVFDIQRLRDGDTTRKKQDAPPPQAVRREPQPSRPAKVDEEPPSPPARAASKPPAPARKNSPSIAVVIGVLVAAGLGGVLIQQRMDAHQAKEAQARKEMADDLSQVTAQIRSGLAEKPASGAASGSTAPAAPLKSPVAVLISEHLAQVQALSAAHEKEIDTLAGDQLMTPGSLATRAGIAANRQKLAAMARSIDTYFAAVKQSKQDYLHRAEALGAKPTPSRDEKMRRVFEFLERAHQANLHMVKSMGEMNDFASQHPPTLIKGALVFNSQTDLTRWRQLSGSLLDDQKVLQSLESEGRQIESSSADELQQQVGKLRQPG